ncbi:hypothetical protein DPEC_G00350960 [Dallia pectoralis]|uniref:Uncharacterized protein n=1 Tax=Dallia pectoralis TaxID=75939 RepID=A0ACC2F1X3_DALPE|nr:hypothetical protein DPEC_G00350960 [Dallia pectoralis]
MDSSGPAYGSALRSDSPITFPVRKSSEKEQRSASAAPSDRLTEESHSFDSHIHGGFDLRSVPPCARDPPVLTFHLNLPLHINQSRPRPFISQAGGTSFDSFLLPFQNVLLK